MKNQIPYVPPQERARFGSEGTGFDPFKLIIVIMLGLFLAYAIYKS